MLETGVVLQNRYRIQRRIGGGGMGVVYLADDTRLAGRQCAVKEMSPAQLAPGDRNWAIQAFRQEAQMLANLHHPGLTNVTDFFPEGGNWYLVMEYIQGETLESRLERAPNGRFTLDEALRITRQICEVLDYLHGQQPPVVFRDLKPGNVMLDEKGQVKLIDFGVARFFKSGRTQDTVNLGTPGYAAPEQYGGMGQTDPRSDIYSLGVLLHQLVTGYNPVSAITPFPLPDPRSLQANLPPHVVEALGRALQLQPHLRYNSVREFCRDLFAAHGPAHGAPVRTALMHNSAPATVATGTASRSGIWIGLGLGMLIIVLVGGTLLGLRALRNRDGSSSAQLSPEPAATVLVFYTPLPVEMPSEDRPAVATPRPPTLTPKPSETALPPTEIPTQAPPVSGPLRLAYVKGNVGNTDIYVADADGRNALCVACRSCDEAEPAWSPDGDWIVYQSNCEGSYDIWKVNSSGGTPIRLTTNAATDEREPDWSPLGQHIVYRINPTDVDRNADGTLQVMQADGSGAYRVDGQGRAPVFSPSGTQLTFMSQRSGSWQIFTYDFQSDRTNQVTQCSVNCRWPAWSPDGEFLIYHSTTASGSVTADTIWRLSLYGGEPVQIVTGSHAGRPTWSSAGWIAFNSDNGLEVVDGSGGQRRILLASDQHWAPSWSK